MKATLEIRDFILPVHLGWSTEERKVTQPVAFTVSLKWPTVPQAIQNDDLSSTLDYAQLANWIRSTVEHREFRLIEKLAGDIFEVIKKNVAKSHVRLCVTKVNAPVEGLHGGAQFILEDT